MRASHCCWQERWPPLAARSKQQTTRMTDVADATTVQEKPPAELGLFARIVGVLFSPKETFAAIAARPKWLGVLAVTLTVGAVCQYLILSSPSMHDAMV